ncbi:MAG TPA: SDR family oxidoreductase [Kofleriaceae bacterium]|jgi:NAD(P)-dependent dehydrogenase (short-subunit alcohol dehydrogenase family)
MGVMTGKTVAITGASSGIGLETARGLAGLGARIVAIVRDRERAQAALGELGDVEIVTADLYSMGEVRLAGAELRRRVSRLDVLVHNAGAIHGVRELTVDGFEKTFALDHLAPFLLTYELRELLAASAPARIVTLSSMGHRFASFHWDDLATMERWPGAIAAYGAAKLCNIWFARESARRLAGKQVTSNAVHPGTVASGFGRTASPVMRLAMRLGRPFLKTPAQGARAPIYLASSPELEGASGLYFTDSKPAKPSRWARDDHEAKRLWTYSEQLCGVHWD